MNAPQVRLPGGSADWHPAVSGRRISDGLVVALAGLACVGIALGIALAMPKPNYPLVVGGIVGLVALTALVTSPRLEVTVGGLVFFLGCLNGPLKLISSTGRVGSAIQDVLIIAIVLGMVIRHAYSGKSWKLPPLAGLVAAFVAVVVLEAFNPKTLNGLKVAAGFREQLQFVPFFIFGWLLVRSKPRLRKMLILLGVIAVANGLVATYQTRLSPKQAAAWGAGYASKFESRASRTYQSEGEGHVRPTGLGDESGAGAGTGLVAIAGTLALLATTKRRRGLIALLAFGAIAAIATGLGRVELVGGVLAVIGYLLLTSSTARSMRRPLRLLLVTLAVALPFSIVFVSVLGEGVFSRYSSLINGGSSSAGYKESELKAIPKLVKAAPFGFGLGTAGPAAGFGGKSEELFEGHNVNAETTYNFIFKEVGLPGLIVWVTTILTMIVLAFRRIRLLADPELQVYLAAIFAPIFAMFFMSFEGPLSQSQVLAPYFWFALGVAAYWLAGPGWQAARQRTAVRPGMASVAAAT
ncbi:MAG TPA: hypothetical protein VMI13_09735 [Solirubrobacteraceae bacterium]|nr:hypothetical protein [Solirubrobacteraceae bacterium]